MYLYTLALIPILIAHHCYLPLPLSCSQLNLRANKLGPEGAKVLAPAIAVCAAGVKAEQRPAARKAGWGSTNPLTRVLAPF